ncbi:acyltransferase domain-containing protein [Paenibacillus daejeonensis]|uniref:acyltransferase domain-containing protein n=1 Tax=Paenibacillus daejeonensis TaxID=135193 RepID=UPI00068470C4|nr:acyltransferase domain-containing protein [Paenibacillus daejeonensis]
MVITRWGRYEWEAFKPMANLSFDTCLSHCRFDALPEGLEYKYRAFLPSGQGELVPRDFLNNLYKRYAVSSHVQQLINEGLEAIEQDSVLHAFTEFLVADISTVRERCDETFYTNLSPACLGKLADRYSFLLLLACLAPSLARLQQRGIPETWYRDIPYQFLKPQLEKLEQAQDFTVSDFPWMMNFYTGSIFLFDRFYCIPHRFGDALTAYRSRESGRVIALRHGGDRFRRDGQLDGVNGIFDTVGAFDAGWEEDEVRVRAHRINPAGCVEAQPTTLDKQLWEKVLGQGDILLALHIPSGPGYTPERVKSSMTMALDFYSAYYPELSIRGFWSESWLYDPRLSLILDEATSNIVQVQRQLYNYPISAGDAMIHLEVFGDRKADPLTFEPKTSLQRAAASYMRDSGSFHTTSMFVLKEEVERIGDMPYLQAEDITRFKEVASLTFREGASR